MLGPRHPVIRRSAGEGLFAREALQEESPRREYQLFGQLQVGHFIRSSHCHVRPLWQLRVSRSCFLVNESHGVPIQVAHVPQIRAFARFIGPERASNWYAGTCRRYPFVRTPNMLELMRNNVNQPAFHRLPAPLLTQFRGPEPAFLGRAIDGVEDCHANEVSQPNRATVVMEIVERRIDYDFDVSSQDFYIRCPKHCPSDRIPLHYIPAHLSPGAVVRIDRAPRQVLYLLAG